MDIVGTKRLQISSVELEQFKRLDVSIDVLDEFAKELDLESWRTNDNCARQEA